MPRSTDAIAIMGAGLATSLGVGREASWRALLDGRVGLGPLTAIEDPGQAERGGGEVGPLPGVDPDEPREAAYLRFAIDEALKHAGLTGDGTWPCPPERRGLMLGTTLHGMTAGGRMVRSGSKQPLRDFLAPAVIARATRHLALEGWAATTCSACSSGLGSILLGATLLRAGELDVVICGGYDPISEYAYAGFNSLRLIDDRLPRPFTRDRAGMKVSEGYGIVVLERAADAAKRGRTPFCRLAGGGESADAHHLTQPMQDGQGAAGAIDAALRAAGLQTGDIDLIVAHATGTPDNDAAEYAALHGVFGEGLRDVPVAALKSRLGHTLGGAGAAELIFAMLALRDGQLPTTANTTPADVDFAHLSLSVEPREARVAATLNTSLGFGGANTCVALGKGPGIGVRGSDGAADVNPSAEALEDVCITGIGVVTRELIGGGASLDLQRDREPVVGEVAEERYLPLLNARRVRRLSGYVKLTLAAATLAVRDAAVPDAGEARDAFFRECPAILGTMHGSTHYSYDYYRGIVDEGLATANPMLFAEGVPNAGAAHLSMMLGLRGACQTVIGSRTAGLDALRLASLRIATGEWDRALVCAGEEHDPLVEDSYAAFGMTGMPGGTAAGAVTLVLESRQAAEGRGARVHATVDGGWQVHFGWRDARIGVRKVRERLRQDVDRRDVQRIIGSANGTWIDRFEAAATRRLEPHVELAQAGRGFAESFSAGPLLAVAGASLAAGQSGGCTAVQATDFNGVAAAIRIRPGNA